MLASLRSGKRLRFTFDPIWWLPSRTEKYFTEQGMVHYRRAAKAMFGFFDLLLLGMLVAALGSFAHHYFL